MKLSNWLQSATKKLTGAGIETARLDCLVLAEDVIGKDRVYLLAHPEFVVQDPISHKLDQQIERRAKHEPLAYIRGKTEFYGRVFMVNEHVLVPRPESEAIIDVLKQTVEDRPYQIVDVGTGSGILAITATLEMSISNAVALDIDIDCLSVAKENAKNLAADVTFIKSDLLEALNTNLPLIILANLPYVPTKFAINEAAKHEPKLALFGGQDGLDLYRKLFEQIETKNLNVRHIISESLPTQHQELVRIAAKHNYKLSQTQDFVQRFTKI